MPDDVGKKLDTHKRGYTGNLGADNPWVSSSTDSTHSSIRSCPVATTMTTVALSPAPLPPKPVPYAEWLEHQRNCLSAYEKAFNAEHRAVLQVEANPINEAKQNVVSARVAGYLLVELFNRRAILLEGPCASLLRKTRIFAPGAWRH